MIDRESSRPEAERAAFSGIVQQLSCHRRSLGGVVAEGYRWRRSELGEPFDPAAGRHDRLTERHRVEHLHPHAAADAHGDENDPGGADYGVEVVDETENSDIGSRKG